MSQTAWSGALLQDRPSRARTVCAASPRAVESLGAAVLGGHRPRDVAPRHLDRSAGSAARGRRGRAARAASRNSSFTSVRRCGLVTLRTTRRAVTAFVSTAARRARARRGIAAHPVERVARERVRPGAQRRLPAELAEALPESSVKVGNASARHVVVAGERVEEAVELAAVGLDRERGRAVEVAGRRGGCGSPARPAARCAWRSGSPLSSSSDIRPTTYREPSVVGEPVVDASRGRRRSCLDQVRLRRDEHRPRVGVAIARRPRPAEPHRVGQELRVVAVDRALTGLGQRGDRLGGLAGVSAGTCRGRQAPAERST